MSRTLDLPTMTWLIEPPEAMLTSVLLTRADINGRRYVELGAMCSRDNPWPSHHNVLAYMVIPHLLDDRRPWRSEYMGDGQPETSGMYLCCTDGDSRIRLLWYNSDAGQFGGADMLAYMPVPAPYAGRRVMQL